MTVHRTMPLPIGAHNGRLIVAEPVADETLRLLKGFQGIDGPHEGLVFWIGRRIDQDLLVVSAAVPDSEHNWGRVFAPPAAVGAIARLARAVGLGIVAQVHSHPGDDTRHSDGDDRMVLMPFEGMYSVVVANYGNGGITSKGGAGVHQYQSGRWIRVGINGGEALILVPTALAV